MRYNHEAREHRNNETIYNYEISNKNQHAKSLGKKTSN
jgi:hypothetical protein